MNECTCHTGHPPCSFCLSLSQAEANAFAIGGRAGLEKYRKDREARLRDNFWRDILRMCHRAPSSQTKPSNERFTAIAEGGL